MKEMREKAMRRVKECKALLLIGSPMCSAFSALQNINFAKMSKEQVDEVVGYGMRHLEFCMELYRIQMANGLYFLHEHPHNAKSWGSDVVKEMMSRPGVRRVRGDMCQYGMVLRDAKGYGPALKPTGFMTNSSAIAERLSKICTALLYGQVVLII